jgi:hypothetical protein
MINLLSVLRYPFNYIITLIIVFIALFIAVVITMVLLIIENIFYDERDTGKLREDNDEF